MNRANYKIKQKVSIITQQIATNADLRATAQTDKTPINQRLAKIPRRGYNVDHQCTSSHATLDRIASSLRSSTRITIRHGSHTIAHSTLVIGDLQFIATWFLANEDPGIHAESLGSLWIVSEGPDGFRDLFTEPSDIFGLPTQLLDEESKAYCFYPVVHYGQEMQTRFARFAFARPDSTWDRLCGG